MSTAFVPASGSGTPGPGAHALGTPQLAPHRARISQFAAPNYRVTLGRSIRSELRKVLTLPSLRWTLAIGLVFSLLITALLAFGSSHLELNALASAEDEHTLSAFVIIGSNGIFQAIMTAFAAVAVCSEYSANTMRSTASADPRRWRGVAARTIAVSAVALVVTLVLLVLGAAVAALATLNVGFSGDAWWMLLNFVIAMVASTWLALGVGYLLRNSAGTIVLILAVMMLSPILAVIPSEFMHNYIVPYLPPMLINAAIRPSILSVNGNAAAMLDSPALGLGLWCALAVVLLALGGWRFSRSDV